MTRKKEPTMPIVNLLIKPASGACNMRCQYCFYADEMAHRTKSPLSVMDQATMHLLIDRVADFAEGSCTFAFQGGEPTLAGLSYFQEFVRYAAEKPELQKLDVHYALQTNGYLLDKEWAEFFHQNHFLIGVSLDGPKDIHDRYRKDSKGDGTYDRILSSIELLKQYEVDFNILTVVTKDSARKAKRLYEFYKQNQLSYQQYIECLNPIGDTALHDYTLTPDRYERFLKDMFDCWYQDLEQGTYVYNRYFENLLRMLDRQQPESCNMYGICSRQWVIEADGSVYPCDFYCLDEWKMGTVQEHTFPELEQRRETLGFVEASKPVPERCRTCRWYPLCRNGCRRHREAQEESRLNYFCSAYQGFFSYAYPKLVKAYQIITSRNHP